MLDQLRKDVWEANLALDRSGLVQLTWGNVSGIDRDKGLVAIKPSGVAYSDLQPEQIAIVDLDGKVVDGELNPSSDTATHVILYKAFEGIGGVTHTHSTYATMFAQACRELPCMGTTHADHFFGPVPVTRTMTPEEVTADYEGNTGHVIVERFADLNPVAMPAVLTAHHAPFVWGKSAAESVKNSIALEMCAKMAVGTFHLNSDVPPMPKHMLDKHYLRKHGKDAYYGQGEGTKAQRHKGTEAQRHKGT